MYTATAATIDLGPGRVLSARLALRDRLQALRPPSRRALADRWEYLRGILRIVSLHHEVFGEYPAGWRTIDDWTLSESFFQRVDAERFPLDWDMLNDCFNDGEPPLDHFLAFAPFGLAWEVLGLHELPSGALPLLAIYVVSCPQTPARCRVMTDGRTLPEQTGYLESLVEALVDWWDTLPHDRIRQTDLAYAWPGSPDGLHLMAARLRALAPPLDGLAGILLCILRQSGNPFLDIPDHIYGDNGESDDLRAWNTDYCWCGGCIEDLTAYWEKARPHVEAVQAYYDWYNAGVTADRLVQVANLLIKLSRQVDRQLKRPTTPRQPRALIDVILSASEESPLSTEEEE